MGLTGVWPRALLAANGLLIALGTGAAFGVRHSTGSAAAVSTTAHQPALNGSMAGMDMSGDGSIGGMSTDDGDGSVLLSMPHLWPAPAPSARAAAQPGRAPATVGVQTLAGPRTAAHMRTFTLVARPARLSLGRGLTVNAWTFGGTSPGPVLRVRQGDLVVVHLVNRLPVPTTIHWHGISVPGGEDGVAGLTQDAVPPGGSYTYRFVANEPGTYWYHAHQDSLNQVARGLFGAVVVAPRAPVSREDIDQTIALHTWTVGGGELLTANGSAAVLRLPARPGATVRLRLVNTDNTIHVAALAGAPYRVVALDGHTLNGPTPLHDVALPIGAGQRYDVSFRAPAAGVVALRIGDVSADQRGLVDPRLVALVGTGAVPPLPARTTDFDMLRYGRPDAARLAPYRRPGPSYSLRLGEQGGLSFAHPGVTYTINGAVAPAVAPIMVKKGQVVHLRITNTTSVVHPMHLHGHFFAVLARNGRPASGSPVLLDTLDVFPNETYDVAFLADNPGVWMLHCHNLVHARQGMGMMVMYKGVTTPFKDGGPTGNISD